MAVAAALTAAAAAAAACDRLRPETAGADPEERVVVRAFADSAAVYDLAVVPPYLVVASEAGLDLWDLDEGERRSVELRGVGDSEIRRIVPGLDDEAVWVVGTSTLGRYHLDEDAWQEVPRVDSAVLEDADLDMAPAAGDGVWLGGGFGLVRADMTGAWAPADFGSSVRALHTDDDGVLWIGAEAGLLSLSPGGRATPESGEGCEIGGVERLASSPGGGVVAAGRAQGERRVAVFEDGPCALFRASPDVAWRDAAGAEGIFAVLGEDGLYVTARPGEGARELDRDGMRLVPISRGARDLEDDYRMRAIDVDIPATAGPLALAGERVWLGTEDRGTAAIDAASELVRWKRRLAVASGGSGLTVECVEETECFLATGATRLWRFDGRRVRGGVDLERAVLGVVGGGRGDVYALRRGEEEGTIEVLARAAEGWDVERDIAIEVPGSEPDLAFAKRSPTGMLWLGLQYRDERGERQPYGVALLDVRLGGVAYHRATIDEESAPGILPVPLNTSDVSFAGGEVWLATTEGAAVVDDEGGLSRYTEADGLRSEILRGIAVNPGGVVFVATRAGVGVYDGLHWEFPAALRGSVRDLAFSDDGRLWMATDRGLAAYDGSQVRRLDSRRGLWEDELRQLVVDRYDRVWVRGREGITIVVP